MSESRIESTEPLFTAERAFIAKRELRDAAGADSLDEEAQDAEPDNLTLPQVIGLLSGEILLLRERGFSNQRIADLLNGFDIPVTEDEIVKYFRDGAREGD